MSDFSNGPDFIGVLMRLREPIGQALIDKSTLSKEMAHRMLENYGYKFNKDLQLWTTKLIKRG